MSSKKPEESRRDMSNYPIMSITFLLECFKRRNLSGDIHRCEDNIKTDLGETVCESRLQTLCFEVILVGICTFTFISPEKSAFKSL
jgi:hypothetical protein